MITHHIKYLYLGYLGDTIFIFMVSLLRRWHYKTLKIINITQNALLKSYKIKVEWFIKSL